MYDVIIVGSGGAGLTAAISAKKQNKKVLVITKTLPTHSQTCQAQGGINAVLYEDNDSVQTHIEDTYKGSSYLASKEAIEFLCKNAKDAINWLDEIGVPFSRTNNGKISQRKFGGTKKIRTCYSSDYTGLKILHTLYEKSIKDNIEYLAEHILLNLILDEYKQTCVGVIVLDIQTTQVKEIFSKSVVLATGGYAGIYSNKTTNSISNTADGLAIAYRNGVKLSNMEFVQFHPTTLKDTNILISESARGEGGYLLDSNLNRFIHELSTRDEISRAIATKINNGENIYLDLRHLGVEKINKFMPQERRLALEFSNIKLEEEILPIEPASHYTMGGIKTNLNGQTNIKNLYAVGECAQADIHGANRLGGNSLLEIIVMGKIVGQFAANNYIKPEYNISSTLNKNEIAINNIFDSKNEINFYKIKDELSNLLFNKAGIFRSKESLLEVLDLILLATKNIENTGISHKSKVYNKNLIDFIEFRNILEISRLTVLCALHRNESRGSHFRTDFDTINETLNKNTIIKLIDNFDSISYEDVI